jgi:serine/threonine-protein kinase
MILAAGGQNQNGPTQAPQRTIGPMAGADEFVSVNQTLPNHYVVERLLGKGQGGISEVFLAQNTHNSRQVAIKLAPNITGNTNIEGVELFERERSLIAQCQSEHIIDVFDVGTTNDGRAYMEMEYASNGDVFTYLGNLGNTLRYSVLEKLITQIVIGVAYLHGINIVHRDIKGENVLITEDGTPIIADFGIAIFTSEPKKVSTCLRGTLGFMPPENIIPKKVIKRTTYLSDVFALGALFYEMLTNRLPFQPPRISDSDQGEVICRKLDDYHWAMHRTPPLPSTRSGFNIPSEMEQIIMKALSFNPHDRYENAIEMLQAITTLRG